MEPRKLRNELEARSALAAVASSGQAEVVWGAAHGVDTQSLAAWHQALERREAALPGPGLRLVELVQQQELVEPTPEPRPCYRVRVGQMLVELDDRFEEGSLRRLLRVALSC